MLQGEKLRFNRLLNTHHLHQCGGQLAKHVALMFDIPVSLHWELADLKSVHKELVLEEAPGHFQPLDVSWVLEMEPGLWFV